ncbi:hypothetical protein JTP67_21305 [Streptomyces sp. S12]|nr:hypothetical protein [Streptomyces sp. S12]
MSARNTPTVKRPRTLADLYEDRDLTPAQARRIVALLGLARPRTSGSEKAA